MGPLYALSRHLGTRRAQGFSGPRHIAAIVLLERSRSGILAGTRGAVGARRRGRRQVDREAAAGAFRALHGDIAALASLLELAEKYAYDDLRFDAPLNAWDFDPKNPEYAFMRF